MVSDVLVVLVESGLELDPLLEEGEGGGLHMGDKCVDVLVGVL